MVTTKKSNKKDVEEIKSIKNRILANKYVFENHPHLKDKINKENAELEEELVLLGGGAVKE